MDHDGILLIASRRDTKRVALALSRLLKASDLIVLDGDLGSGKTFLVRALCRALGLDERIPVTSPTFALVHEIATTPAIAHADLYRIGQAREVDALGLVEQRADGRVVIAEWGRPYVRQLGGDALVLEFRNEPRRITCVSTGERSESLRERLLESVACSRESLAVPARDR